MPPGSADIKPSDMKREEKEEELEESEREGLKPADQVKSEVGVIQDPPGGVETQTVLGDASGPLAMDVAYKGARVSGRDDPTASFEVAAGSAGEMVRAWTSWLEANR
jgi:hypothetical protein